MAQGNPPTNVGSTAELGPLPEPAWVAPQWITEDAYSAEQMQYEKAVGATEAAAWACNELSAALGWPRGISAGPLPWGDLLREIARLRISQPPSIPRQLTDEEAADCGLLSELRDGA